MDGDHSREDIGHRLRLVVNHDVLMRRHPATWEGVAPLKLLDGPVKAEPGSIGTDNVIARKLEPVPALRLGRPRFRGFRVGSGHALRIIDALTPWLSR